MFALRPAKILPFAFVAAVSLSAAPVRAADTSRWIAALPFGAGQFQNGNVALGIFFAGSEALLGATSIVTAAIAMKLVSTDTQGLGDRKIMALHDSFRAAKTTNHVAFTTLAVLAAAGVTEAQVNLVPRRTAPAPQRCPSFAATAAPILGGGLLGVRAAF